MGGLSDGTKLGERGGHDKAGDVEEVSAEQAEGANNATASAAANFFATVQKKYSEEREKRVRAEGTAQYMRLHDSEMFAHFTHDPWLPADGKVPGFQLQEDQRLHFKFVIQGAGYSGLLFGARFIEAGYKPEDIVFVDSAGGFGGTWYWNRYPGLMCDVAASIYMPLLEETNYVPKHKYSYGIELREHADRIVEKYGFSGRSIFRATTTAMRWNDAENVWEINVTQEQGPKQGPEAIKVSTKISGDYVVSMSGLLNYPKLPRISGLESFKGHQFHTSRWDYKHTGGSQEDQSLRNLQDKVVALVGTGPTTIQALPELAKWAKYVYVVQRTPSAIDVRGQRPTDVVEWKKLRSKPGWQIKEMDNFASYVSNDPDRTEQDMIDDGWTHMPSFSAVVGGPNKVNPADPSTIIERLTQLHSLDLPRQERLRSRIDEVVKDQETAERLKPWYPGWCKRPGFHDEYLQAFNCPNVELIDSEGRGIEALIEDGFSVLGKQYKVDTVIWGTGFTVSAGEAGDKGRMKITGKGGLPLETHFNDNLTTIFGSIAKDFPNLFCFMFYQGPATVNAIHCAYNAAKLAVFLVKQAESRHPGRKLLIEPEQQFGEEWAMRCAGAAASLAALNGCTPSYTTQEGAMDKIASLTREEQIKVARRTPWGQGICDYERIVDDWYTNGNFQGVDVTVVG